MKRPRKSPYSIKHANISKLESFIWSCYHDNRYPSRVVKQKQAMWWFSSLKIAYFHACLHGQYDVLKKMGKIRKLQRKSNSSFRLILFRCLVSLSRWGQFALLLFCYSCHRQNPLPFMRSCSWKEISLDTF